MEQTKNKAVKTAGFMMVIMLAGKILGLFRDILLANYYGAGMAADAFTTASIIPRTFFDAMFASAISASFIPVFNQYRELDGEERAFSFAHVFISFIGVITIVLTAIGIGAAKPLVAWFADGFDAETTALCIRLLRIMFPTVFFTGIAYSFVGILQSLDEFGIPAALSIVSNGIIILYYLFFNRYFGIFGLAAAFFIGWAMQAVMQLPALRKKGYRFHLRLHRDPGLSRVGRLMLPVMVSTWVQPINLMICTKFASRLFDSGGVANINYANNLYTIIVGVFVSSVANVIFPELSRQKANADDDGFGKTINTTTRAMCFLLLPMLVGLFLMSGPIVKLLYERNSFTPTDTLITARALRYFTLGMLGFGLQTILSRAFYAEQNGKTPLLSGAASILVNLVLCRLLAERYDVAGLGVASAVAATVSALVLVVPMKKRDGQFLNKAFGKQFLKMLCAALGMGVVVYLLRNALANAFADTLINRVLLVALPTAAGVLIYLALALALRIDEAKIAFGFVNRLRKKMGENQ